MFQERFRLSGTEMLFMEPACDENVYLLGDYAMPGG